MPPLSRPSCSFWVLWRRGSGNRSVQTLHPAALLALLPFFHPYWGHTLARARLCGPLLGLSLSLAQAPVGCRSAPYIPYITSPLGPPCFRAPGKLTGSGWTMATAELSPGAARAFRNQLQNSETARACGCLSARPGRCHHIPFHAQCWGGCVWVEEQDAVFTVGGLGQESISKQNEEQLIPLCLCSSWLLASTASSRTTATSPNQLASTSPGIHIPQEPRHHEEVRRRGAVATRHALCRESIAARLERRKQASIMCVFVRRAAQLRAAADLELGELEAAF